MDDGPGTTAMERWRENLRDERDGIALYDGLAALEKDPARRRAFLSLAEAERRHAGVWEDKLRAAGAPAAAGRASIRVRTLLRLARLFGPTSVLSMVIQGEEDGARRYLDHVDSDREAAPMAEEEAGHRDTLERMRGTAGAEPRAVILRRERWHRGRSGSIRAAVFGVNDGLVSNVALVLGVAAAGADPRTLLITGLAGLLAGALSMAVGEYVSVASQRDLLRRQVELEARELADAPEEEAAELAGLFERKGLSAEQARKTADEIVRHPETAVDTLVREELGLDPDDLGSPMGAAGSSFLTFAIGAVVPLAPFLIVAGRSAAIASGVASGVVLAVVGGALGVLSGTSPVRGALRMVGLAALAAAATIAIGRLVGSSL